MEKLSNVLSVIVIIISAYVLWNASRIYIGAEVGDFHKAISLGMIVLGGIYYNVSMMISSFKSLATKKGDKK